MIAKLIDWLFGRRADTLPRPLTNSAPSADSMRQIFFFWDGSGQRAEDPMRLFRGLLLHPEFERQRDFGLLESGDDRLVTEAMERIAKAVRDVFGIREFDNGAGLTIVECLGLLKVFYSWCESQKKSGNGQPTSRPSTELECSDGRSNPGNASLGCGSTSGESIFGEEPQTCSPPAP